MKAISEKSFKNIKHIQKLLTAMKNNKAMGGGTEMLFSVLCETYDDKMLGTDISVARFIERNKDLMKALDLHVTSFDDYETISAGTRSHDLTVDELLKRVNTLTGLGRNGIQSTIDRNRKYAKRIKRIQSAMARV